MPDGFAAINLTSMMDLLCVLLIIFIIATPVFLSSVSVSLPKISSEQVEFNSSIKYITVTYTQNQELYVNDIKQNNITDIIPAIEDISKNQQDDIKIFIEADENCKYGDIMSIVSFLNKNNYTNISFLGSIEKKDTKTSINE
jgi:biopolymer transport protein ExbD